MKTKYQYIIIGAGIMGMSIARAIEEISLDASILIIDKVCHFMNNEKLKLAHTLSPAL